MNLGAVTVAATAAADPAAFQEGDIENRAQQGTDHRLAAVVVGTYLPTAGPGFGLGHQGGAHAAVRSEQPQVGPIAAEEAGGGKGLVEPGGLLHHRRRAGHLGGRQWGADRQGGAAA